MIQSKKKTKTGDSHRAPCEFDSHTHRCHHPNFARCLSMLPQCQFAHKMGWFHHRRHVGNRLLSLFVLPARSATKTGLSRTPAGNDLDFFFCLGGRVLFLLRSFRSNTKRKRHPPVFGQQKRVRGIDRIVFPCLKKEKPRPSPGVVSVGVLYWRSGVAPPFHLVTCSAK